jgi:2,4-dienoyl-CoA reductase (NADPH2)
MVLAEQPDAVVVATGARVETPVIPGAEQAHVLTGALMRQLVAGELDSEALRRLAGWQRTLVKHLIPLFQRVLTPGLLRTLSRHWLPLGKEVVIVGADLAAVELAEFLARRGRRVHLLDSARKITPEVGKKRRNEHMDRLDTLRVTVNTAVEIVRIEKTAVVIARDGKEKAISGDSIIVAGTPRGNLDLAEALRESGLDVRAIGDATGLGLIAKATRTAAEAMAGLA